MSSETESAAMKVNTEMYESKLRLLWIYREVWGGEHECTHLEFLSFQIA